MLGYLPRDVSQCLSPLIDNYDLKLEVGDSFLHLLVVLSLMLPIRSF